MKKLCKCCGETKDTTQFSKCKAKKDGLQPYCKECNKQSNKKFRKENPKYWSYETGYFSDKKKSLYIREELRADKDIKIYLLEFPFGKYIGCTKKHLHLRMNLHLVTIRGWKRGHPSYQDKTLPFYQYFKDWDMKDIEPYFRNPIILETAKGNRKKQYQLEKKWITEYIKKGENLVNYHWVVTYS